MELTLKLSTIRRWKREDAVSLAEHANSRNIWLSVRDLFPHPYMIQDAETYLERITTEQQSTSFCIEVDGRAVGGIGLRLGKDVARYSAELGYWLGEAFWNKGIMSEAVAAFTDYSFNAFALCRLEAYIFQNNNSSARVLEKASFVLEGRLKNSVVKDGKLLDSFLYARTTEVGPPFNL